MQESVIDDIKQSSEILFMHLHHSRLHHSWHNSISRVFGFHVKWTLHLRSKDPQKCCGSIREKPFIMWQFANLDNTKKKKSILLLLLFFTFTVCASTMNQFYFLLTLQQQQHDDNLLYCHFFFSDHCVHSVYFNEISKLLKSVLAYINIIAAMCTPFLFFFCFVNTQHQSCYFRGHFFQQIYRTWKVYI